jgi:hypothetical protein
LQSIVAEPVWYFQIERKRLGDDERVTGDVDVDVLEVVLTSAADAN